MVIRSRKLKADNTIFKRQKEKTMMYKTQHRKLNIDSTMSQLKDDFGLIISEFSGDILTMY
jgi:hypothetical protein